MQIALLVFIVIFALAIGFFLGLFLLSMNSPLLNKLFQKDETESEVNLPGSSEAALVGTAENVLQIKKPNPNSKLLMQVWKEEGKPPVYDLNGTYVPSPSSRNPFKPPMKRTPFSRMSKPRKREKPRQKCSA